MHDRKKHNAWETLQFLVLTVFFPSEESCSSSWSCSWKPAVTRIMRLLQWLQRTVRFCTRPWKHRPSTSCTKSESKFMPRFCRYKLWCRRNHCFRNGSRVHHMRNLRLRATLLSQQRHRFRGVFMGTWQGQSQLSIENMNACICWTETLLRNWEHQWLKLTVISWIIGCQHVMPDSATWETLQP